MKDKPITYIKSATYYMADRIKPVAGGSLIEMFMRVVRERLLAAHGISVDVILEEHTGAYHYEGEVIDD